MRSEPTSKTSGQPYGTRNRVNYGRLNHPREYASWASMIMRCTNPNRRDWPNYGARGIAVCDEWTRFAGFLADMGERPAGTTIDRIDVDGPYCKANCRWATNAEQGRNTRKTKLITFNGETMCMKAWAHRYGLKQATLWKRLNRGWSVEQALTEPMREHRPLMPYRKREHTRRTT